MTDAACQIPHTLPADDGVVHLRRAQARMVTVSEKEALIAQGISYGELLTEEGTPNAEQQRAFADALARNGAVLGKLIASLTAEVLREYRAPVLVSLARAGTPIGYAMRRLARRWGRDLPHHTLSIIRGVGIDTVALQRVRAAHPQSELVFVDGWTGKGSIYSTLSQSLPAGVPPRLAVLSDPAGVALHAATHSDLLLPHAALNATVCGLLSRTFYTNAGELHAARTEEHLRDLDQTMDYLNALDALTTEYHPDFRFNDGTPKPQQPYSVVLDLAAGLGVTDPHLVKPSVGEATRVFLRRAPAHLMLQQGDHPDTRHLLYLAESKGVPVSLHPTLPYLAAALIKGGST